jgi:hypothetical protein
MQIGWTKERILSKVSPEPNSGCWLWAFSTFKNGYGQAGQGEDCYAHRVSYRVHRGAIPAGLCVLHRCDQRSCVNPDHLFVGTIADNHADMRSKKRQPHGETHGHAKLTRPQVEEIRAAVSGGAQQKTMAERFGVSRMLVSLIVRRKIWNINMGDSN